MWVELSEENSALDHGRTCLFQAHCFDSFVKILAVAEGPIQRFRQHCIPCGVLMDIVASPKTWAKRAFLRSISPC